MEVVLGDGALGHQPGSPYDRIVATVGAYGVPDSWLAQLAPTGIVVPVRIRGSVSRSIAFERDGDGVWRSVDHQMCGFVPLREGIADDPRRKIPLTADRAVTLQLNQEHTVDPAGLFGVFDRPVRGVDRCHLRANAGAGMALPMARVRAGHQSVLDVR